MILPYLYDLVITLSLQDGKGVALKSCNQFLVYIKEAEPEDDDPE